MTLRVITVEDVAKIAFTELRPGCAKGVLQEGAASQAAVIRVRPGSGVPTHMHSRTHDLFFGLEGELEIRHEGPHGNGVFRLAAGGFCSVPAGVRHEVSNASLEHEAVFLLIHTAYDGFDIVRSPFLVTEAALPFSPKA